MIIGLDIDGCLSDFNRTYMALLAQVAGEDLWPPDYVPTTWNYATTVGYTSQHEHDAWEIIKHSNFWSLLDVMSGAEDFLELLSETPHDVYFITSRPGERAKMDTEDWLMERGILHPTVLISSEKGECCHALKVDLYLDDKNENCLDVMATSVDTDVYMLAQPWNSQQTYDGVVIPRIATLQEFLEMISGR